ncbi:iron-sulfur cluster repair di-iron protein ScdA [Macrococcus hajekii]|uniref:Iron-sulfur cluster repair di-iron protein ScdA n=1 Tax=Macrococcus hajekii TaxID=198482 RepID=A0A4R6BID6_9STAP|nr:iron-sulfur cluster repair di-iron protein ScdA [Macrococcus hajekii]TDM01296.1 iron-sulfur cluster repair di-iron protein ScdA [Macrococcus hajekii]GGB10403.1 iron-sulfur cluster repair protein ScdA [Macrococcus hajekii]
MITKDMLVADIVKEIPKSADIFRNNRIDFCCGGQIPLSGAVNDKSESLDTLLEEINSLQTNSAGEGLDVQYLDNASLINYIQNKYHIPLREEMKNLTPYVTKVARVHGERHPELVEIKEVFTALKNELLDHTQDEDDNVFPLVINYTHTPTEDLRSQLQPHIDELETEHENAGNALKRLRELTHDFTPPMDACGTYRLVFSRLEQLEKDTFNHVHLENNVLFKRF